MTAVKRQSNASKLDILLNDFDYLREDVTEIKQSMKDNLITRTEFNALQSRLKLVEKAVYGAIGIILSAFIVFLTTQWRG